MPDEKDFYKDIIDNLYDGVYFVDRDPVITYWNKGAERITGYSATRTIGRWGIAILHNVQDRNALRSAAEKVRSLVGHSRLDLDGQGLTVTMSTGGTLLLAGDTPNSFVGRADELMYRSKQAGRNRVTIG